MALVRIATAAAAAAPAVWRRLVVAALLLACVTLAAAARPGEAAMRNPLLGAGGDPWLVRHDGRWTATYTVGTHLEVRSAPTLGALIDTPPQRIWPAPGAAEPENRDSDFWAPELHRLRAPDGSWRWYVYYAAGPGTSPTTDDAGKPTVSLDHRMHVLESDRDDPRGPYHHRAALHPDYGIDMTVHRARDGRLYAIWSGHCVPGPLPAFGCQALYLAPMRNPWTLAAPAIEISVPTNPWEMAVMPINEGPVVIEHGTKLHVLFSASFFASDEYKIGRLTVPAGADLGAPATWRGAKHASPIFTGNRREGVLSPGHNGVFRSPDGSEDWIVYHAHREPLTNLTSFGAVRTPRIQRLRWSRDDDPVLEPAIGTGRDFAAPAGDPTHLIQAEDQLPAGASTVTDRASVGEAYVRYAPAQARLSVTAPRWGRHRMWLRALAGPSAPDALRVVAGGRTLGTFDLRSGPPGFRALDLGRPPSGPRALPLALQGDGEIAVDEVRLELEPPGALGLPSDRRCVPKRLGFRIRAGGFGVLDRLTLVVAGRRRTLRGRELHRPVRVRVPTRVTVQADALARDGSRVQVVRRYRRCGR